MTVRMGSRLGSVALVAAVTASLLVVSAGPASAAGTPLFTQSFHDNALVPGGGEVVLPAKPWGVPNDACLTTTGSSAPAPLQSCWYASDTAPNGVLSLNTTIGSQLGGVFAATSVPATQGLRVSFDTYQWGGTGADGISFVLAAVDPALPLPPAHLGQAGGTLGYTSYNGLVGFSNGYLGIGFDPYGAYSTDFVGGADCTPNQPFMNGGPGQVTVRGPGNGTTGYCGVNSTGSSSLPVPLDLRAGNRASSRVPVEIVINPTTTSHALTTHTVAPGAYGIVFTPIGDTEHYLTGPLPVVPDGLYTSDGWLADGIPKQLAFGWVGSTGGAWDNHEISDVTVESLNPVPVLTVTQTAYSPVAPVPGDPVTYVVQPGVSASGADETAPVTMTMTVPSGVTPVGVAGAGWVCPEPIGQTVTCVYDDVPIPAGTALPPITVSGAVTQTGLSDSEIRAATVTTVASEDANPGLSTGAGAGTVPGAPTGVTVAPALGSTTGGGAATISGTNIVGASTVRVGTNAELQSGTATTLVRCTAGPAADCFTDAGDGTLTVSSMPAHARGTVIVQVATLGIAGSDSYAYVAPPSAPLSPAATAGASSATVTFSPPSDDGGAPVTGYTVTPHNGAVAGVPVASASSPVTVSGLTPGTAYTFTVSATNIAGTGSESVASSTVTPYATALNSQTIAVTPDGTGYWLVSAEGEVAAFGSATAHGGLASAPANPVVGISSTATGEGYWLVSSRGHVLAFGDAQALGSTPTALHARIVGMTATRSGKGYWVVASDGGIFAFGDATFHGSTGAMTLNQPVVGIAATPTGNGYWLVAADGGVFAFGDAEFYGSTGAMTLNQAVVGIAATRTGNGYRLVAADGGVFTFGDAAFYGSTAAMKLSGPVTGIAMTPAGRGYWMAASDGGVFSFGDAKFYGSGPGSAG